MTECAQQPAHQRGLAGAEVTFESNYQLQVAATEGCRQCRAQCKRCGFIGQQHRRGFIIAVMNMHLEHSPDWARLAARIKEWGRELGFGGVAIAGLDLGEAEAGLMDWLAQGCHGEMDYMAAHDTKRARPAELVPGTLAVISVRLDYWPDASDAATNLAAGERAYVSRYALGRDYHKVLRGRLQRLAERIEDEIGPFAYRAFSDSAPVMEVELANRSGLGWRGKHTLLLTREAGSWFFLGELYVALPLPVDALEAEHCGSCSACIRACPTGAIVAPYRLDARRCISYLTIELKGSIPLEFRPLIGNRVYGCDDCQLCCPWNRFARPTQENDFSVRNGLDQATLVELFSWNTVEFEARLAGSAIRRIGHERWLRNIAVGLGNAATAPAILQALETRRDDASAMVREHVSWALARHRA
jgi:epoxyqueuosine reductase